MKKDPLSPGLGEVDRHSFDLGAKVGASMLREDPNIDPETFARRMVMTAETMGNRVMSADEIRNVSRALRARWTATADALDRIAEEHAAFDAASPPSANPNAS